MFKKVLQNYINKAKTLACMYEFIGNHILCLDRSIEEAYKEADSDLDEEWYFTGSLRKRTPAEIRGAIWDDFLNMATKYELNQANLGVKVHVLNYLYTGNMNTRMEIADCFTGNQYKIAGKKVYTTPVTSVHEQFQ
jgi:hypothetical protein